MSKSYTHFRVHRGTQMHALKILVSAGLLVLARPLRHSKILRKISCVVPHCHCQEDTEQTGCSIGRHWMVSGQQIRWMAIASHLMAINMPRYLLMKAISQKYTPWIPRRKLVKPSKSSVKSLVFHTILLLTGQRSNVARGLHS